MLELMVRLFRKWRPPEGWLLWVTALAVLLLVPAAAETAGWVPYLGPLLAIIVLLGYWAGFGLTRRQVRAEDRAAEPAEAGPAGLSGWLAAIILAILGVLTVSLVVGWREAPAVPEAVPWLARPPARAGLALAEMADRLAQWGLGVRSGGAVQDDAVFRWIVGLFAWAAAAWAGWWLYGRGKPLAALLPAGLLLAMNAYYYWDGRYWLPFYLGLLVVVAVFASRSALERRWRRRRMDYSEDARVDVILSALGISLIVAISAFAMPRIVFQPTADWFEGLVAAPLDKLSETGTGLFPGLKRTPRSLLAQGSVSGMPRAYLLGSSPELGQELVMRVSTDELDGLAADEMPSPEMSYKWRALTYDVYDGRGWRNSPLKETELAAGRPWFEETPAWRRPLTQRVELRSGGSRTLFAAGEPLAVNRPYRALSYLGAETPVDELAALVGNGRRYDIVSLVPAAGAEALAAAGTAYPPAVAERYLQLPKVPDRVAALARSVTGGAATPYDQAVALERYLRQYPYDLDVAAAPAGQDVVDYFLFTAERGYCDYYASAMAVMARSLGIPARLATGYATGDYDPGARAFVVYGDDAHTWPELYFSGVGWVPFEPTGSRERVPLASGPGERPHFCSEEQTLVETELQAFQEQRAAQGRLVWILAVLAAGLAALVGVAVWWLRPAASLEQQYAQLGRWGKRLGRPAGPGETAGEFGRGLGRQLVATGAPQAGSAIEGVEGYIRAFEGAQYGPQAEEDAQQARRLWPGVERLLRVVWVRRLLSRRASEKQRPGGP